MSELLDRAVEQAKRLPIDQQNAIAALILEEIEDEQRWHAAFARSSDALERLATEAEKEDRKGLTEALDPDAL